MSIAQRFRAVAMAAVVLMAVGVALGAATARVETSARDMAALKKASLIYIATVRKDGNQSKAAPVWFTVTADNRILIETGPATWKAKRIRRGSPAIVWIGAADGPAFIGKAETASDPAVQNQIITDYPRKYLLARVGFARPSEKKFEDGKIVAIRITPIKDLPANFQSAPGTPAPRLAPAAAPSPGK
jgi:Pyridoxamine 5'-phosphate oxidase